MDNFGILQITLYIIAAILHAIGLWLLSTIKLSLTFGSIQRLFFINISTCDILGCILSISSKIAEIVAPEWSKQESIMHRISISGMYIWYIGLMTLLTMDRFLSVYLNLRYHIVCTLQRARLILFLLFVFSLTCTLVCLNIGTTIQVETVMVYAWLVLDGIFLCIALLTYIYFFRKIKSNRRKEMATLPPPPYRESLLTRQTPTIIDSQQLEPRTRKISTKIKKTIKSMKRSFFTPSLLIGNFTIFWLLPDQIFFWLNMMHKRLVSPLLVGVLLNFYPFGILLDAVIYIFFQREILSLLRSKIQKLRQSLRCW